VYDTVARVIRIDVSGPKPLEEQITQALRQALAQGGIAAGDELPSVRQLAGDLGVHWNTVARAYRRLADEGLVVVRRGRGAVVRDTPRTVTRMTRSGLRDRFAEVVAAGLLGGASKKDMAQAFEEALAAFGDRKRS
jgi:DNA-binding transcriptional regulator YhcF (GntR family)